MNFSWTVIHRSSWLFIKPLWLKKLRMNIPLVNDGTLPKNVPLFTVCRNVIMVNYVFGEKLLVSVWLEYEFFWNIFTRAPVEHLSMFKYFSVWYGLEDTVQYSISQEICTRFCCALLCCGYAIVHNELTWSIYPYSSGLVCWHWGNR